MTVEFALLNIGRLSRNRYWGERDDTRYREARCTCTLFRDGHTRVLMDPCAPPEEMEILLYNQTGLRPSDIDMVFVSHHHKDHLYGITAFPSAAWYMPSGEMKLFDEESRSLLQSRVMPAAEKLTDGIRVIPLPGHTPELCGLAWDMPTGMAIACADAVMTRDYFLNRQAFYTSWNFDAAVKTIRQIESVAHLIIPGHDNYFLNSHILRKEDDMTCT